MAEGIFKQKTREMGLEDIIESDSAGTAAYHIGENPDPKTLDALKKHGISFNHTARRAIKKDADRFDFILAMDSQNYRELQSILPSDFKGLFKMRDFDQEGPGTDVPDPYYGADDGFENVFEILDRSIDEFITKELLRSPS